MSDDLEVLSEKFGKLIDVLIAKRSEAKVADEHEFAQRYEDETDAEFRERFEREQQEEQLAELENGLRTEFSSAKDKIDKLHG